MDAKVATRELLYGVTALRLGLVDRPALAGALAAWRADGGRPLATVLVDRGLVGADRLARVEAEVKAVLAAHGDDVERALDASGPVAGQLRGLAVPDAFETISDMDSRALTGRPDPGPATERADDPTATIAVGPEEPPQTLSAFVGGPAPAQTLEPPTVGLNPATVGGTVLPETAAGGTVRPEPATGADPFATVVQDQPQTAFPASGSGSGDPMATMPATRSGAGFDAATGGDETWFHDRGAGTQVATPTPRPAVSRASGRAETTGAGDDAASLRYQVLQLHARGGLGEVFLARDVELNREVALKEIQGKHAHDHESRARFLIEAEVTGGLEHPGIVPVYGLGRYPDGRPYYAMRFIRGETLKDAIDRYHKAEAEPGRDPGASALEFRKLLGELVDVCQAMAYAHSRGVLHRDLKPGNVMIGGFGETLVVDWGLAKFQDVPETGPAPAPGSGSLSGKPLRPMSAGSTSRTLYGSAVGTPQYMSPEQAAGELDKLGPVSDVYSLGAILYTILTGQAPFRDKQLTALLYKVFQGDFPRPRAVNPKADPALEAVCLKAMARQAEDRYPTARALAEDIEHWLADEPVSVYREPVTKRLARWARRHRTAVASAAVLLVTAAVSLGIYSVLIRREQARTLRFYGLARLAVDRMLTRLGEEGLADTPQLELVRREMLDEARRFYTTLRRERGGDPTSSADTARAALRLGDVETLVGQDREAEAHYNEAVAGLTALSSKRPGDRTLRQDLTRAYQARGLLRRKAGRNAEAEADLKKALELRDALLREPGATADDRRARTETVYQLAALDARLGRTDRAAAGHDEAVREQGQIAANPDGTVDDRRREGRYLNNQANLLRDRPGGRADALAVYRKAHATQTDVVRRRPEVAFYRYELGKTSGNIYTLLGGGPAAEPFADEEVKLARGLTADFPKVPDYRHELSLAETNLGGLQAEEGRRGEALRNLNEAVELAEALVKNSPDRVEYREALASALLNRGKLSNFGGERAEAEADFVGAVEALRPLEASKSLTPRDAHTLGQALTNLGGIRALLNRRGPALADLDAAVSKLTPLVRAEPDHREYRTTLATALYSRSLLLRRDPALVDLRAAADLLRPLAKAPKPVMSDLRDLGRFLTRLAEVLVESESRDEASKARDAAVAVLDPLARLLDELLAEQASRDEALKPLDEAVALLGPASQAPEGRADVRDMLALALQMRGKVLASSRQWVSAGRDARAAADLLRTLARDSDPASPALARLGRAYSDLAAALYQQKRFDDALRALEDAARVDARVANPTDGSPPPLWLDFRQIYRLHRERKSYAEAAEAAERLPSLRPDDPKSAADAARILAYCAEPRTLGDPADASVQSRANGYADRALKVLRDAAARGLLDPAELRRAEYNALRRRADFRKLEEDLKSRARRRAEAPVRPARPLA